jgi:hypothetical protein
VKCFNNIQKTAENSHNYTNIIGDIYSGKIYQEHINKGRLGKIYQSSYCLCTDGVRLTYVNNT